MRTSKYEFWGDTSQNIRESFCFLKVLGEKRMWWYLEGCGEGENSDWRGEKGPPREMEPSGQLSWRPLVCIWPTQLSEFMQQYSGIWLEQRTRTPWGDKTVGCSCGLGNKPEDRLLCAKLDCKWLLFTFPAQLQISICQGPFCLFSSSWKYGS